MRAPTDHRVIPIPTRHACGARMSVRYVLLKTDICETAKGRNSSFEPGPRRQKGRHLARTVGLRRVQPGRFYQAYKAKTTTEATFPAIKGRFAYRVMLVAGARGARACHRLGMPQHLDLTILA